MDAFTKHENTIVDVLKAPVDVSSFGADAWHGFTALWDTGAQRSVVTSDVARILGLVPISNAVSRGVNAVKVVPVYLISIRLPGGVLFNLQVTEGDSGGGWDVLIGMDVISHGDFCVSNFDGKTAFSFRIPSAEKTDYVQIINESSAARNDSLLKRVIKFFSKK